MEPTGLELWLTVIVGWGLIFVVIYLVWDRILRPQRNRSVDLSRRHHLPPQSPRSPTIIDRLIVIVVYYVGGVVVCGAIAIGNGVNGHPYWYSLIAPAINAIALAFMDGPGFSLPRKKAAIGLGLVSVLIATAGHLLGPALVTA